MSLYDREDLKERLHKEVLKITFEKVDGTIREMKCTLMPEYLPPISEETKPVRAVGNPNLLAVWDLEKNDWRSMRVASIQTVIKEDTVATSA